MQTRVRRVKQVNNDSYKDLTLKEALRPTRNSCYEYHLVSPEYILFVFVAFESTLKLFCDSTYFVWIEHNRSQLLAWCSRDNNNISIIDLEMKGEYAKFQGVQLKNASKL